MIILEDVFKVERLDPDGKKFDKGMPMPSRLRVCFFSASFLVLGSSKKLFFFPIFFHLSSRRQSTVEPVNGV